MTEFPADVAAHKLHFKNHEIANNAPMFSSLDWTDMKLRVELIENVSFRVYLQVEVFVVEVVGENFFKRGISGEIEINKIVFIESGKKVVYSYFLEGYPL